MTAVAISNNDMVYLHWHVDGKIPGCLGFKIVRYEPKSKAEQVLPAMVGFAVDTREGSQSVSRKFRDTAVWPIQKYAWKDVYAPRGGTYWYEIVPMIGTPGNLKADDTRAMRTNSVVVDAHRGDCSVYFNRGIISTQAVARNLSRSRSGLPNSDELKKEIAKPSSTMRKRLVGDLSAGVLSLLHRAEKEKGQCYCALYELSDKELVDSLAALGKRANIILSNAGEDTEEGAKDGDSTNIEARKRLHKLEMKVTDRMLKKGHIGHNKFIVYVNKKGPQAVLSGSTNWTPTGLCAQSNNAIVIESPELAREYLDYWKLLKKDTLAAGDDGTALQAPGFRASNLKERKTQKLVDGNKKPAGNIRVWFSPNTRQKSVPRPKNGAAPTPADLGEVFDLIRNAKQGALFLAFIPGKSSIVTTLKEVHEEKKKAGKLFYLRGAATSPDPAGTFRVDLYDRAGKADATVRPVENPPSARANASVASVAGIFASFAKWEAEIYKLGHAVIHDKLLVLDPFTDNSVVITGSHNLGFKASYANDENLLVIKGNRGVAEAYAAHVLDVYEHYRWRWKLQQPLRDALQKLKEQKPEGDPKELWAKAIAMTKPNIIRNAWKYLRSDDGWQDFYVKNKDFFAAETNFWSSFEGEALR